MRFSFLVSFPVGSGDVAVMVPGPVGARRTLVPSEAGPPLQVLVTVMLTLRLEPTASSAEVGSNSAVKQVDSGSLFRKTCRPAAKQAVAAAAAAGAVGFRRHQFAHWRTPLHISCSTLEASQALGCTMSLNTVVWPQGCICQISQLVHCCCCCC